MKAFIFDPLWDELVTPLLEAKLKAANVDITVTTAIAPLADCSALFAGDEERLLCLNPDYVNWKLTPDDYKDIPNLKGIFGAATSFSWIDSSYANEQNVPICNIKNFSTQAVTEWATMTMLNLARQTPRLIKDGFPLDFEKDFMRYRGIELRGKTVGIIGLGNIGSAIAERCAGLGMHVTYWSRSTRSEAYEYKELAQLMAESDVIFPILAKNEETKALITTDLLQSIKPTAIIIDEVGDGLVDHGVILDMVKNSKLFGFGFEAEPAEFNKYSGNVWAAPAYGWVTDSSMQHTMEKWIENMVSASNGNFPNRIN